MELLYRSYFGVLCLAVFLSASAGQCLAEQYQETIKAIKELSDKDEVLLPQRYQAYLREIPRMKKASYSELLSRYRSSLRLFTTSFPEFSRQKPDFSALKEFKGKKKLIDPEVYGAPFLLLATRSIAGPDSKAYRQTVTVGKKKVPLLKIKTKVLKKTQRGKATAIFEGYIATLNARIFGFSKAQAIAPLLKNARPSPEYDYNGMRDWSTHSRLRKTDQITRPIKLTNFAHTNGDSYSISAHPDFSLDLFKFRSEKILMTFFLWQTTVSDVPDLIYQIEYKPR